MKKYQRRITANDITVYLVSGVLAGTGVTLSSVTMVVLIAVPIVLSAVTTIGEVIIAITKIISSRSQTKLHEYSSKYTTASNAYSQLSPMISISLDDEIITDEEFSAITAMYNSAMLKLEIENTNSNNVTDRRDITDTSTDQTSKNNVNFVNNKIT